MALAHQLLGVALGWNFIQTITQSNSKLTTIMKHVLETRSTDPLFDDLGT